MRRTRDYPRELKLEAVRRVQVGEQRGEVARRLGIDPSRVYAWCDVARRHGLAALRGRGRPRREEASDRPRRERVLTPEGQAARRRIADLEGKIGRQELALDFFRQALRHVKARQQEAAERGGLPSTRSSKR